MSIIFDYYGEKKFTKEFRDNIDIQLRKEIQNFNLWDKFRIDINLDEMDFSILNPKVVMQERDEMEFIAKLSRDLLIDYDYFKQFSFENEYNTNLYKARLSNLGYIKETGFWRNKKKPEKEDVKLNVFVFCLYQLIIDKMNNDVLHKENSENTIIASSNITMGVNVERDNNSEVTIHTNVIKCIYCETENNADRKRCLACESELSEMIVKELEHRVDSDILDEGIDGTGINNIESSQGAGVLTSDNEVVASGSHDGSATRDISTGGECVETREDRNSGDRHGSQQVAIPMKSAMVDNKDVNTSPGDSYTGATASTSASLVPRVTTWSCPSCTYNNSSDTTCCVVCFTIPQLEQSNTVTGDNIDDGDDVDVVLEVPTGTWKCKKCHGDNLFDTYICDKCHEYAPFFHKWVCEQCRFFNEILSPKCGACGINNRHLIKCTKCKHNMVNKNFDRICDTCNTNCCTMNDNEKGFEVDKGWTEVSYKKCVKCNNKSDSGDPLCKKCTGDIYYCNNRWCGSININKLKHCRKCKLKKGSNITDFNMVEVHGGNSYMKMWQCTFCGLFHTLGKVNKCTQCKNMRHSVILRKCSCNWINKTNASKCDKCFKILPKRS